MKSRIFIAKYTAIGILILGIIHNIATFTPLIKDGLECLSNENLSAITYMSLICGSSLIVSGLLLVIFLNKLKEFSFVITPIRIIIIFLCLNGVLAITYMSDNPFAWITFLLSLILFITTLKTEGRPI